MSSAKQNAPWGSWPSTISATMVATSAPRLAEPWVVGKQLYWLQSLPEEKGRVGIMCNQAEQNRNILPAPYSVRSKVHEYGGRALCFTNDTVYFVNADDQGIYALKLQGEPTPRLIYQADHWRFAELQYSQRHQCLFAVGEEHSPHAHAEVSNKLVCIQLNGELSTLASGADFYAYPRLNANEDILCWISWQHPKMPWDQTTLTIAKLNTDTATPTLQQISQLGTHTEESLIQPQWHKNGDLFFISDKNNWWNIYQLRASDLHCPDKATAVTDIQGECATPLWSLGMQNYALDHDQLFFSYTQNGFWQLAQLDLTSTHITPIGPACATLEAFSRSNDGIAFIQSGFDYSPRVCSINPSSHALTIHSQQNAVDKEQLSQAQALRFHQGTKQECHAFYYPAHNKHYTCKGRPPLIVLCHGGPTGQSDCSLNYKIQYWTNRGFAVVDINYRGSTGYGRDYRHSLYKKWGLSDVEDMINVCQALTEQGLADPEKRIIKGSSAGGYTVLAALCFSDMFQAGVSLYGIGDLSSLAADTHKFEQHYLDQLIGPYPADKRIYEQRSPINFIERFNCPLLLFQGLDDKVVPPNQARAMADNVRQKGLAVAHIEYADEGHGFRQASTIKHMLNAELYFYQRVFKLGGAQGDAPIHIDNLTQ